MDRKRMNERFTPFIHPFSIRLLSICYSFSILLQSDHILSWFSALTEINTNKHTHRITTHRNDGRPTSYLFLAMDRRKDQKTKLSTDIKERKRYTYVLRFD